MSRPFDDFNDTSPNPIASSCRESPSAEGSQRASSPSSIPSGIKTLKAAIESQARTPQISRKVRACSACKKQKIRCHFDTAGTQAKCVRCRRMKLECVVNRSLQTILDEDVEWKVKLSEEIGQLQRAVDDILKIKQMRPLSTYAPSQSTQNSPVQSVKSSASPALQMATLHSASSPPVLSMSQTFGKDSVPVIIGPGNSTTVLSPDRPTPTTRMPMTRENSPEAEGTPKHDSQTPRANEDRKGSRPPFYDHYSSIQNASLSTNPMGSLYEVTRLRSLRSNSTTNVPHAHALGSDSSDASGHGRHANGPSGLGRNMSLSVEDNNDDLITRGMVGLEEAEELFELFRSTLSHYLFDVALVHDSLSSVRSSSHLLLASILTVASLHRPATASSTARGNSNANTPTPSGTFGVCYQHFLTLVSSSMFDFPGGGHHIYGAPSPYTRALDNVRALSIAAFWLPDLSWKLSGHAVRIATELNVHQSFRKALMSTPVGSKLTESERMKREQERKFHYERVRLWYLLYVCDHHFSIAYGRPPVICYSQHEAIRDEGYERYLTSDLCKEGDFRVVSQMALFVVLERIYEYFAGEISEGGIVKEEALFGTDSADSSEDEEDSQVDDQEDTGADKTNGGRDVVSQDKSESGTSKKRKLEMIKHNKKKRRKTTKRNIVEEFSKELDDWRENWCIRLRKNAYVGDYPAKGVQLHYHFAKLQLNSLALRGVTSLATNVRSSSDIISNFSPQRIAMARLAIESARHVLTTILTVEEIRVCLIGVPLYVHTMIAFAAVFLMKVASRWSSVSSIEDLVNPVDDVWKLVEKVVGVLRDVARGGNREVVPKEGKGKGNKKPTKEGPSLRGAGEMHIVWYIAGGLEKMMRSCRATAQEEEEKQAREQHKGKWEAVWQESGKVEAPERAAAAATSRRASADVPVAPGVGGPGMAPPVEPKLEQPDYPGGWGAQPLAFNSNSQHSQYQGGTEIPPRSAETSGAGLHSYSYTSTSSDSHGMYAFDHQYLNPHDDPHHDDMSYDPAASGNHFYFTGLSPYEFFTDSANGQSGLSNIGGIGYKSFGGFDLFGGGTMEALPMVGTIESPSGSGSIYAPYLQPSSGAAGHHQ